LDFDVYEEMLAGKPDAGNPHVRFDEGVATGAAEAVRCSQLDWLKCIRHHDSKEFEEAKGRLLADDVPLAMFHGRQWRMRPPIL
jgi:hypothetical protein